LPDGTLRVSPSDTIFALSSGRPPAAIAVIRISGPRAHEAGTLLAGDMPDPRTASVRQLRDPRSGDLLDEALIIRFDSPASSTGDDIVEIQCHGGGAIIDGLLGALASIEGLRIADPGEFTRRAFENGRIDLTEAEGLADLIEAETESQRKAALALAEGGLRKQVASWQEQLLGLSAEAEHAIDYDDADEPVDVSLQRECARLSAELGAWLQRPRVERLKDGIRVVVAGPPNAGKSSLINMIAGEDRAIVTEIPGTTRDYIEVPLSLGGVPILLTDTAGLRDSTDQVEVIGVARTASLIERADILIWLGDAANAPEHPRSIAVHSKADLPGRSCAPEGSIPVSSLTGDGMDALLRSIEIQAAALLPTDDAVVVNRRQATELEHARDAAGRAAAATDWIFLAEELRLARSAFDRLTGRAGVEDVLDALFSRFCLGK
jgi:tRNA modification GTPase